MKYIIIILTLLLSINLYSQDAKDYIKKGNELYKKKKFNDAEISYRKAAEIDPKFHESIFNLGDALYKQGNYDNAAQEFQNIINKNVNKKIKAKAYHNLGNALLKSRKIQESIDAYKQALKLNPKDLDTKYNLEYAKKLLIQQKKQNKQNQKNKNQKQNKQQQNKNQQQQNKQQQNQKNKQQQQQQQQQKQQGKQQQQQMKKQKISKKDAERILQALNNEEKKLNKKLKKHVAKTKAQPTKKW